MRILYRFRLLALGIVLLFVLEATHVLNPVERTFSLGAKALQGLVAPLRAWERDQREQDTLKKERATLRERVMFLEKENTQLFAENETLRQKVQSNVFLQQKKYNGVFSTVLGRSAEGDDQIYTLDRGALDGVKIGMAAVDENGVLLGTIIHTRPTTSSLLLPTAAASEMSVEVQNASRSQGLLRGEHGLTIRIELLPAEEPIELGQRVVTGALDVAVPAAILIGTIADVRKEEGELFQTAILEPSARYDRLRSATILLATQ